MSRSSTVLGTLLLAVAATGAQAQVTLPITSNLDVNYGLPGQFHADQRFDMYQALPAGSPPSPVVVFLHSGGFIAGDENLSLGYFEWQDILARGWTLVSVQYRLAPTSCAELADPDHPPFPGQVADLSLALQFLRMNAANYNIDPDKIVLYGKSAGGALASWVGLADDRQALAPGVGHGTAYSTRVRAVLNGGGPTDWTYANPLPGYGKVFNDYFGVFPGCPLSSPPTQADLKYASPVFQAIQSPQVEANQYVAFRNKFFGPVAGNLHDPYYGIVLDRVLTGINVSNVNEFLDWDLGPISPLGMDPAISNTDWFELAFAAEPYGSGTAGTYKRGPAMALVDFGPDDSILVGNCKPNTSVTLWGSLSPLAAVAPSGAWIAAPIPLATEISDGNGDAVFDLDFRPYKGTGIQVYFQASTADPLAPNGFATTQGLHIDLR
ncbi:MAG: alpha/beta hydrolase [Planctomycetota bacterium]